MLHILPVLTAALLSCHTPASDGTVVAQSIHRSLTHGVAKGLAIAVVSVLVLLLAFLGSPRLALLSLVPNLVPLLLVLAVMAVAGIGLSISTSVIFTIAFGIAIDDTVHVLAALHHRVADRRDAPLHEHVANPLLQELGVCVCVLIKTGVDSITPA